MDAILYTIFSLFAFWLVIHWLRGEGHVATRNTTVYELRPRTRYPENHYFVMREVDYNPTREPFKVRDSP